MCYFWRPSSSSPSNDFVGTYLPALNPFPIKIARVISNSFNSNFFQNFCQIMETLAHHAIEASCQPQDIQNENMEFVNSPA